MASVFAVEREREKKKVSHEWNLPERELRADEYAALRSFVESNLKTLFNLKESRLRSRLAPSAPAYQVAISNPRKERGVAYVVGFRKSTSKKQILERLAIGPPPSEFQKLARDEVAQWFARTSHWTKAYLFVVIFRISEGSATTNVVGLLTSDLAYGSFVEHPNKIVEQLRTRGVLGDTIKKGIIFPHVLGVKGSSYKAEDLVKVYEETHEPAQYFYDFCDLEMPRDPDQVVAGAIDSVLDIQAEEPLRELSETLEQEDRRVLEVVPVVLRLGTAEIKIPLDQLDKTVHLLSLPGGRKGILLVGERIECAMGGRDLLQAGLVKLTPWREMREVLG